MSKFFTRVQSAGSELWEQAQGIWLSGGWAMIAIAAIALIMFGVGLQIHLKLRRTGFRSVPERTWRRWIESPAERRGPIGDLLDVVTGGETLRDTARLFDQVQALEKAPFERDLKVMKVCVSAAPLVGLLGTVTGMLSTFGALSSGSGGDQTMGMVAGGISEALVTTETGLVIALPGLFFQYQLVRGFEHYKAFLAHLETVCTQVQHRGDRSQREQRVRRAALARVASVIRERLLRRGILDVVPTFDTDGADLDPLGAESLARS